MEMAQEKEEAVKRNRLIVRARSKAMTRLSYMHSGDFTRLLNEERSKLGLPLINCRRMSLEELAAAHGMKLVPADD